MHGRQRRHRAGLRRAAAPAGWSCSRARARCRSARSAISWRSFGQTVGSNEWRSRHLDVVDAVAFAARSVTREDSVALVAQVAHGDLRARRVGQRGAEQDGLLRTAAGAAHAAQLEDANRAVVPAWLTPPAGRDDCRARAARARAPDRTPPRRPAPAPPPTTPGRNWRRTMPRRPDCRRHERGEQATPRR